MINWFVLITYLRLNYIVINNWYIDW
jgi:hypothetical protein